MKSKRDHQKRFAVATTLPQENRAASSRRGFLLGAGATLAATFMIALVLHHRAQIPANIAPAPVRSNAAPTAPEFAVRDLAGNVVRLSDLRGQPVILNFWATWCPPCRAEVPALVGLQAKYAAQGLRVIGVAMDDEGVGTVGPFVKENAINYTIALPDRDIVARYGGVENLPTTFYIGGDGNVVQSVTGLISPQRMEEYARLAMAAPTRSRS